MNRTTELPTTKETTTDPTTIIMGTPFLVVRKSDAVKTQYENSVKKSRQKMKWWIQPKGRASFSIAGTNFWPPRPLCSGPTDSAHPLPVKNVIFANHTEWLLKHPREKWSSDSIRDSGVVSSLVNKSNQLIKGERERQGIFLTHNSLWKTLLKCPHMVLDKLWCKMSVGWNSLLLLSQSVLLK